MKIENLVRETSVTEGLIRFVLSPLAGYRSFSEAYGIGAENPFLYAIRNDGLKEWEWGIGYMVDEDSLSRNKVLGGSNGNDKVDFSPGNKEVYSAAPGEIFSTPPTISGLVTNPGASQLEVKVSPGRWYPDDGSLVPFELSAEMSKRIDLLWSEGQGGGLLDQNVLTENKWYNIFVISSGQKTDLIAARDLSPKMPDGYYYRRRILSYYVDETLQLKEWKAAQLGGGTISVEWTEPFEEFIVTDPGTEPRVQKMTVPDDYSVFAFCNWGLRDNRGNKFFAYPDYVKIPGVPVWDLETAGQNVPVWNYKPVLTTLGQVSWVVDFSAQQTIVYCNNMGWIDGRTID